MTFSPLNRGDFLLLYLRFCWINIPPANSFENGFSNILTFGKGFSMLLDSSSVCFSLEWNGQNISFWHFQLLLKSLLFCQFLESFETFCSKFDSKCCSHMPPQSLVEVAANSFWDSYTYITWKDIITVILICILLEWWELKIYPRRLWMCGSRPIKNISHLIIFAYLNYILIHHLLL